MFQYVALKFLASRSHTPFCSSSSFYTHFSILLLIVSVCFLNTVLFLAWSPSLQVLIVLTILRSSFSYSMKFS